MAQKKESFVEYSASKELPNTNGISKKFPSLKEFLLDAGVDKNTPEEKVDQLKQDYRKYYHKFYQQHKRKKLNRLEARFNKQEFGTLKQAADLHHYQHLSRFLKEAALAYVRQGVVLPDTKAMDSLTSSIKKVGHLINQIVQRTHGLQLYAQEEKYIALKTRVGELEQLVQGQIFKPRAIDGNLLIYYLQAFIHQYPEYKNDLMQWLEQQEVSDCETAVSSSTKPDS